MKLSSIINAIVVSAALAFSMIIQADGLVYQVVDSELTITPDMVANAELIETPRVLKITLTEQGLENLNALIRDGYGKTLNVIFDGQPVALSLPIRVQAFSSPIIHLSAPTPGTLENISRYLGGNSGR